MNKVHTLQEAVSRFVRDGDHLATGGFTTSRKPIALVHEIIRQGQTGFVGESGPAGYDWDILIGSGRVEAYVNCYTADPRFSNVSRRFRAAVEEGTILFDDYSQDAIMMMYHGASLGVPYLPVRMMLGSGMEDEWGISETVRKTIPKLPDQKFIIQDNPFEPGEKLLLLPMPKIDTALLHVQMASTDGTCRILGDPYQDVDIAFAAKHTIVTCEELVDDEFIRREPEKNTIPGFAVDAVVHVPYGAHPSQCYQCYDYDIDYYTAYGSAGKSLESFQQFVREWVVETGSHYAYLNRLGAERLLKLKVVPGLGFARDMTAHAKEAVQ